MAHFSVTQTKGCTEILQSLSNRDLLALKDTVASKLIKEDVISVILNSSQSAEELLKRKKVLREAILTYLIRHKVCVSASSDKQQLIDKALAYWMQQEWKIKESRDQRKYQLLEQVRKQELERKVKQEIEEEKVRKQELERKVKQEIEERQVRKQELERRAKQEIEERQVRKQELERRAKQEIEEAKIKALAQDVKEARRVLEQTRQAEGQLRKQVEEQMKRREQEKMRKQAEDKAKRQQEMQMNIHVTVTQVPPQPAAAGDFNCQTIGEAFCQWYFQLLNSQNPLFGRQPEEWGPQHFWEDAVLHFAYSVHEDRAEQHQSAEIVSQRLLSLVKDEQLLFNPNISENGMRCATSPHGLVAIAVAGTIHKNAQCLGIFEQLFGLIRTPVDGNNLKIKYVTLQVKAFNGQQEINPPYLSIQLPVLQAHLNELSVFLKCRVIDPRNKTSFSTSQP